MGKSHLSFVAELIDVLNERGHTVDLLISHVNSGVAINGTTNARRMLSFGLPGNSPYTKIRHLTSPFEKSSSSLDRSAFEQVTEAVCKIGLESGDALDFLTTGNYAAAIVSDYEACGFILARAARIPTVMSYTSTSLLFYQSLSIGLPSPASCVSDNFEQSGSFSFQAKVNRLYRLYQAIFVNLPSSTERANAMARKIYGPDFPSFDQIHRETDLVFVNSNEVTADPHTISHKVKYIGGMAMKKPKPLNEKFSRLLDTRPKGSIIISFGTQVPSSLIPDDVKHNFVRAFEQFPEYTFIWNFKKENTDEKIFANTTNVLLVDWLPIVDLLYDKRVVGFISHLGLNSLLETSFAGVPVVAVPLFLDQPHNTRTAVKRGTAVALDKTQLSQNSIVFAISEILNNQSYAKNAKRIAKMLREKPETSRRKLVDWVEFAAENPHLHEIFNLREAELGFFSYYCIDVFLGTLVFIVMAIFANYLLLRKVFYFLIERMKAKRE